MNGQNGTDGTPGLKGQPVSLKMFNPIFKISPKFLGIFKFFGHIQNTILIL